jgi:hypothetical protein
MSLAQALWQTGRDPSRARVLVHQAMTYYREHPGRENDVRDIEVWLEQHGLHDESD